MPNESNDGNTCPLVPGQQLRFAARRLPPLPDPQGRQFFIGKTNSLRNIPCEIGPGGKVNEIETIDVHFRVGAYEGSPCWLYEGALAYDQADVDFGGGPNRLAQYLAAQAGARHIEIHERIPQGARVTASFVTPPRED